MAWTEDDRLRMRRAIALAHDGQALPGKNPIGCVIVRDGTVIREGCNEVGLRHDATAHAEIVSMRRAGEKLACEELRGAVLYTTLQPCGMCTMASIWAKIGRIVMARAVRMSIRCISRTDIWTRWTSFEMRSGEICHWRAG